MKKLLIIALIAIVVLTALTVSSPDILDERVDYYNQLITEKLFGSKKDDSSADSISAEETGDDYSSNADSRNDTAIAFLNADSAFCDYGNEVRA